MMDQDRFEALAEAFGGDLKRWPQEAQTEAEAFAAARPEISEAVLSAARALDEVLAAGAIEAPSEPLYQRIVADGVHARRSQRPVWAAAAAAVMLTVGLGAGWIAAPSAVEPTEEIFALAFGTFETNGALSLEEEV